jgi:PAS domain S-box-containing protein
MQSTNPPEEQTNNPKKLNPFMSGQKPRAYKVIVAVVFGLMGFGVNFMDIEFLEGATFKISILAGLFFPLVITLAWGWHYGLLSALAGGCQTMWWLWQGDGWGIFYSVPVFTLWIVWHGWWAERRSEGYPWYVALFAVEVPFRIIIELGFLVVFRWLVSLNPPPWNPDISWNHVSSVWLQTVAIKHIITAYVLLMTAYVMLSLGIVRRFFGLPPRPAQSDTRVIYAGAVLFGLLLCTLDVLVNYFAFPREGQTFWGIAVHGANAQEIFMRSVYIGVSMVAGVVLARVNRRRAELQDLLDHRNRILAAIRNVNQLIVREKNPLRLLEEACRLLVENQGYFNVWIVLITDGQPGEPFFHVGFNGSFAPMAERLRIGDIPVCAQAALLSDSVQVKDNPAGQCKDCPLSLSYAGRAGLSLRIEHSGRVFGWMSLSCHTGYAHSTEEHDLLKEVAGDIAFALWAIETETQRKIAVEKYTAVLDTTSDAVVAGDLDGKIKVFNPGAENLFECSADEAIGSLITRFCPEDQLAKQAEMMRLVLEKGTVAGYECERLTAGGRRIPVEVSLGLNPDAKGQPLSINAIFRDITERKKAEAEKEKLQSQLVQAQKMESVGRLAGGVAHDYNNMLSVIMGNAELALDMISPDSPLYDHIREIINATDRSADITRQLLAFARKQTIRPVVLDLNESVEGMFKILRRLIGENINLSWQPEPGRMPVFMDPSQLDQILANLCINARDAISGVGKIFIETGRVHFDEEYCADHAGFIPGEFIMLTVSDNGCGMDRDTLDNIFEPFFTTKGVGKGTGLGLSTVYGIVKQNNGFINVYSEQGQGTTFRIYLCQYAGKAGRIEKQDAAEIPMSRGETILIVEDETSVLKLAQKILENLGYTVLAASTPSTAVVLAEEHAGHIHLLLTDVVMPEMNGRHLSESLKTNYPALKVLFMSGYTANAIAHQGVLDSDVNFIHKPFSNRDLAIKVRDVLDRA